MRVRERDNRLTKGEENHFFKHFLIHESISIAKQRMAVEFSEEKNSQ